MLLTPGLYPVVRAVPHPVLDTPIGFLAEVYQVSRPTWWQRVLSWFGLRVPIPKRLYVEPFPLPTMPAEVEAAYLRWHLDLEFGLASDEQLLDAMRVWKKIVARMKERARQHAEQAMREVESEMALMNFEIEVV